MLSEEMKYEVSSFLEKLKQNIIDNHIAFGQRASGSFINGLKVEENENGGQLIDGAGYSYFLEYGRGATGSGGGGSSQPLLKKIEQWFAYKGLVATKQFNPYSVTAKIHKEGTRLYRQLGRTGSGSGVITGAINDNSINEFFNSISDMFHKEAFSEVTKELTI